MGLIFLIIVACFDSLSYEVKSLMSFSFVVSAIANTDTKVIFLLDSVESKEPVRLMKVLMKYANFPGIFRQILQFSRNGFTSVINFVDSNLHNFLHVSILSSRAEAECRKN